VVVVSAVSLAARQLDEGDGRRLVYALQAYALDIFALDHRHP
jgi:hypothetical protein